MKRVLIVEHERPIQALLEYAITPFEDVDIDWTITDDVEEAFADLRSNRPQVVVVDINLPNRRTAELITYACEDMKAKIILVVPMGYPPNKTLGCKEVSMIHTSFEPNELRLLFGRLLGIHVEL